MHFALIALAGNGTGVLERDTSHVKLLRRVTLKKKPLCKSMYNAIQ